MLARVQQNVPCTPPVIIPGLGRSNPFPVGPNPFVVNYGDEASYYGTKGPKVSRLNIKEQNMGDELTALEKAHATRDVIRAKLDTARSDLTTLDDRRKALSFAAHSEGGVAKKELDGLNKHRAIAVAEIESLEIAVVEASRRVDDAHRDADLQVEAEKAERALAIRESLARRAAKLDKALAALAEEGNAFHAELRELNHTVGCRSPNEFQFQSLGERAVKSALMFSPFKIEHIAPGERRTFVEVLAAWGVMIERWAHDRLPAKSEAAE